MRVEGGGRGTRVRTVLCDTLLTAERAKERERERIGIISFHIIKNTDTHNNVTPRRQALYQII